MSKNVLIHIDGNIIAISSNDGSIHAEGVMAGKPVRKWHRHFPRKLTALNRARIMREVIRQLGKLETTGQDDE